MGSGKYLKRAIEKHGIEAFSKEIIHIFDNEEEMNAKEAELVTEAYCLREDTYNLCPGGKGGWGYINANPELKSKLSSEAAKISNKNLWSSKRRDKAGKRISAAYASGKRQPRGWTHDNTGSRRTEETKAKMSKAQSGRANSQHGTFWINNGVVAKKCKGQIPEGWKLGRKIIL